MQSPSSLEYGFSAVAAAGLARGVGTGQLAPDMGVEAAVMAPGELPPALHLCSTWCSRCLARCRSACADEQHFGHHAQLNALLVTEGHLHSREEKAPHWQVTSLKCVADYLGA